MNVKVFELYRNPGEACLGWVQVVLNNIPDSPRFHTLQTTTEIEFGQALVFWMADILSKADILPPLRVLSCVGIFGAPIREFGNMVGDGAGALNSAKYALALSDRRYLMSHDGIRHVWYDLETCQCSDIYIPCIEGITYNTLIVANREKARILANREERAKYDPLTGNPK